MYTYNLKDGRWFARRKLKLFKDVQRRYGIVNIHILLFLDVLKETKLYQTPATPIKKQTVEAHEANKVISSQKV